jgi:hypothetical protein
MRVAAAFRGVTVAPMPAAHRLLALSDVPDRQRRDGPPELVVGCKHPVIPVPVLARRRYEIGEPVEKLKRREVDDAIVYRRPDRGSAGRGDRGSPATCL